MRITPSKDEIVKTSNTQTILVMLCRGHFFGLKKVDNLNFFSLPIGMSKYSYMQRFIEYVDDHPEKTFFILENAIASEKDAEDFLKLKEYKNIFLPKNFWDILENK